MNRKFPIRKLAQCALFAALMAICAQISIPFWPANICLTLFAIELCGFILKPVEAVAATLVYIILGVIGIPVFTGFKAGPQVLFNTTGGYIFGYVICAFVISYLLRRMKTEKFLPACGIMAVGVLLCYVFGTIWFIILTGRGIIESLSLCVIPFLLGDAVKILLAAWLGGKLKPILRRYL